MQYLGAISKMTEWSWLVSKAKTTQQDSNPRLWPNHWCHRSWSWPVLWRPTRPSRNNTEKACPFHHRGLECESRRSRDTWSNRQVWLWSTKWSGAKANGVLSREHSGQSKYPFPTIQGTTLHMDITKSSILKSDWLCFLQLKRKKLYTVSKNKIWS